MNEAILKEQIKRHEGEVLEVYEDSLGYLTLGVGHLIQKSDPEYGQPAGTPVSQEVVDMCMQAHGAKGFSQDVPLFPAFVAARTLRMADGPDEVHWRTAARLEMQIQQKSPLKNWGEYPVDRTEIFRRSGDPISEKTKKILEDYSRL